MKHVQCCEGFVRFETLPVGEPGSLGYLREEKESAGQLSRDALDRYTFYEMKQAQGREKQKIIGQDQA